MSNNEIISVVNNAIKEVLNEEDLNLQSTNYLMKDLGVESIDLLDIGCELENSLGKEIDFKDVIAFANKKNNKQDTDLTIQDIVDYLEENKE